MSNIWIDDKVDATRYAVAALGQFETKRESSLWDDEELIYGCPKCITDAVRRIRQLQVNCPSFPDGNVIMADVVLDGKFLMQVPAYAIPHVHRIFKRFVGMPHNQRTRTNMIYEIRRMAQFLREYGLTAWPFPEPEPVLRIPMNLTVRTEGENKMTIPEIKKVIYSGSKTIIIWADGTKTITSCAEGEEYDEYYGFCSAVVKKLFGSTTAAKKAIKKFRVENKNKKGENHGNENSCV